MLSLGELETCIFESLDRLGDNYPSNAFHLQHKPFTYLENYPSNAFLFGNNHLIPILLVKLFEGVLYTKSSHLHWSLR